jgi:hypothetical protein
MIELFHKSDILLMAVLTKPVGDPVFGKWTINDRLLTKAERPSSGIREYIITIRKGI